jgi:hypothetical protein
LQHDACLSDRTHSPVQSLLCPVRAKPTPETGLLNLTQVRYL